MNEVIMIKSRALYDVKITTNRPLFGTVIMLKISVDDLNLIY